MDDLTKEFLVESFENLDLLDRAMVELERDPRHKPSLDNIFRTIHTLKGTCGFVNFGRLEKLAHVGENLLSKIREGKLMLTTERASALLSMVDSIRRALAVIEQTGAEPQLGYEDHLATLSQLTEDVAPAAKRAGKKNPKKEDSTPAPMTLESLAAMMDDPPAEPAPALASAPIDASPVVAAAPLPEVPKPAVPAENAAAPLRNGGLSESTIRVDVAILDKLMNLVGELVLARNQIVQFSDNLPDKTFHNACQRLNLITSEIQESFMKTRMQPIENIFGKFPRIIRDLCNELGKRIRLETSGNETELDRTIIEAIKDPLTHILRNSVDHGVESPAKRESCGKSGEGTIALRAYHEGGQVNIEIRDDGAGINAERVKEKAIEKGLISADQAARMSEREAFNLVFLPGFSTAEKITNVSGRGVGMDVVRTNIARIGGSVDINSELGAGTTLKIKIPLTLAIIPALVVTSGGENFAIPQVSLVELVRLEGEKALRGIENLHGVPVYRLRGQLLPLAYLNRELQLTQFSTHEIRVGDVENIVVLQADGRQFGLVVDEINDTEEIVVKPLGKHFKSIECFAGATIMGDGHVALILDVLGLAHRAKVIAEVHESALHDERKTTAQNEEKHALLLFEGGEGNRMALPLSKVARLEQLPVSDIERAGQHAVVQYRGQIMPLIELAHYVAGMEHAAIGAADPMHVVVHSKNGRSIGLVVGRISEIVDETLSIKHDVRRAGIIGSAVIEGRVTDLLDLDGIISAAAPELFETANAFEPSYV
jgi:two-component system chemotaxis sensor kinase CheA